MFFRWHPPLLCPRCRPTPGELSKPSARTLRTFLLTTVSATLCSVAARRSLSCSFSNAFFFPQTKADARFVLVVWDFTSTISQRTDIDDNTPACVARPPCFARLVSLCLFVEFSVACSYQDRANDWSRLPSFGDGKVLMLTLYSSEQSRLYILARHWSRMVFLHRRDSPWFLSPTHSWCRCSKSNFSSV